MTLASAIYEGSVRHRRMHPTRHAFTFPLFMVYLDLAEFDAVFNMTRWWSASRPAPARFRRSDYLGDPAIALHVAVRDRVEQELGIRPTGPVRMLTQLRSFGFCFNPVTFYYCMDASGQHLDVVVAEITNTPWGERHAYVLDRRSADASGPVVRWRFRKEFHVSPFMPMDIDYDWAFTEPGDSLLVHMNLSPIADPHQAPAHRAFDATLALTRHELTPARMRAQLIRFPFMTARTIARIHFEAIRLWLKRVPVHAHPGAAMRDASSTKPTGAPKGILP